MSQRPRRVNESATDTRHTLRPQAQVKAVCIRATQNTQLPTARIQEQASKQPAAAAHPPPPRLGGDGSLPLPPL